MFKFKPAHCRGWKKSDLWNLKVEKTHIPAHEKKPVWLFWHLGSNLRPAWTRAGHFASCWEQKSKTLRIYIDKKYKNKIQFIIIQTLSGLLGHSVLTNRHLEHLDSLKTFALIWGSWRCLRARRGSSAGCCFSWAMSPLMKHGIL